MIEIGPEEITDAFQDVMLHLETPVIRSAGVPLYLLARSTREQGITVVATGEGADELYWGYDLFKEAKVRAFCARDPDAAWRASLFDRMYPYFASTGGRRGESWRRFFLDAGPASDPLFSHQTRIAATSGVKSLYSGDTRAALAGVDPLERLRDDLPEEFGRMSVLERAAYLELTTLLGNHLLAAQADRVGMAHGIEGRFPFLDHRVFEHSVATAPRDKMVGLHEKLAIRRVAAEVVPPIVAQRPKQPYRAPEAAAFFADEPEWVTERLSPEAVAAVGIYDERAVAGLVRRCRAGRATGFRENMALMGVLSTQVWHDTFCTGDDELPRGDDRAARAPPPRTTRTGGERRLALPGGGISHRITDHGDGGQSGSPERLTTRSSSERSRRAVRIHQREFPVPPARSRADRRGSLPRARRDRLDGRRRAGRRGRGALRHHGRGQRDHRGQLRLARRPRPLRREQARRRSRHGGPHAR